MVRRVELDDWQREKCGFVELDEPPHLPYAPHPGSRFYAYRL